MVNRAKEKQISHDEHCKLAEDYRKFRSLALELCCAYSRKLGKNNPTAKRLKTILNNIDTVKSQLDSHYHSVTTDEQFRAKGHVYYTPRPEEEKQP